ncbi:hypothetical protein EDD18DRAFT_274518 [Armillaria luteobubalina]|uniref:Uncharacterized protein n=1 Tax=Armillaria luteobubalina TaxID=153913 RepID=A0AA39TZB2_9AGAR|nr:hypothetical protein EDD18DRAFT_274518 [Armillaria luteobubalina]
MAEVSIAIRVCLTILTAALPWHWKFIISNAVLIFTIGTVAYFGMPLFSIQFQLHPFDPSGFDASKRMQKVASTDQNLYMHYFVFDWAWNEFAYLIQIAEKDLTGVSNLHDAKNFISSFEQSFIYRREKL